MKIAIFTGTIILPTIIPASMGVSIMELVLWKSQGIVKNHEIAQD